MSLKDAIDECKKLDAKVFKPESRIDYYEIQRLRSLQIQDFQAYWMAYKLADTSSYKFPPVVSQLDGNLAPQ